MPKEQKIPTKDVWQKMKRLELILPENYGFIDDDVWYHNERFLEDTHELVMREYGGHSGYEVGVKPFQTFLEKDNRLLSVSLQNGNRF